MKEAVKLKKEKEKSLQGKYRKKTEVRILREKKKTKKKGQEVNGTMGGSSGSERKEIEIKQPLPEVICSFNTRFVFVSL